VHVRGGLNKQRSPNTVGSGKRDRGFRKIKAAEGSRLRLFTESEAESEVNGAGSLRHPGEFGPLSRPYAR